MSHVLTMSPLPGAEVADEPVLRQEETLEGKPNETSKVSVFPYWTGSGSPFPETTLPFLYAKTKEDKLLRRVFPQENEFSLPDFISKMSTWPLLIAFNKATNEPIGYSFLTESSNKRPHTKAMIGFLFFSKWWGEKHHPETRDAGRIALDWWFFKIGIAVLYGTILSRNRPARAFSKSLYFEELCEMPIFFVSERGPENCMLVCLTRDEFTKHFGPSRFGDNR